MKVAFATLGCRVNQYESEAMAEKFIKDGYEVVDFNEISDVYVINTCTVTNMGDKKSRQMIGRAKRKNENSVVAVVGCYAQIKPEEISQIEGVDIVLGTRNKGDIVNSVNKVIKDKKQVIEIMDVMKNKAFEDLNIDEYQEKTRAFIKIQDGCNRFCSYCLIPYARGAVCSKEPEKVIEEVERLASNGFKEIILSGIHTASYGSDLKDDWDLTKLLEKVDSINGIERVRIGSIDPTFFTPSVIDRVARLRKFCPQFHLSLQSGCDETLKRMNRRYTTADYKLIVEELREKIPKVSLTTDVIVGFPYESEEEFNKTYEYLKDIKLSKMHIFKYSPREGTKAFDMENNVDGNIKEQRSKKLIDLDLELEKDFMKKNLGTESDVLFEQKCNNTEDYYEGYTTNYIKVVCKSDKNLSGKIIRCKLIEINDNHIIGEPN